MPAGRVFILESPNPCELLKNLGERQALEQVCKLLGHDAATFILRDIRELKQTFNYISAIKCSKDDKTPLFIHISAHGNNSGIGVGCDVIDWAALAESVQEMYDRLRYYHGPIILVLSTCGANKQRLTLELSRRINSTEKPFIPPEYVFVFSDDKVLWEDAVVAWTIFYREALRLDFIDKGKIQRLLDRLHNSDFGNLKYHRWDNSIKKYKFYPLAED